MQSNKASKKTRKDVSEPVAASSTEVSVLNEKTAKPRASKSSLSKSEGGDTAPAKRHRKAATVTVTVPEVREQEPVAAPKAMVAAAGSGSTAAVSVDAVRTDAAPVASPEVSRERIQELAYQYWVAEGRPHGNDFEHWLRAERELGVTR